MDNHREVIIIGSGPSALTSALYCGRAQLQPLVLEGELDEGMTPGGQLMTTTEVENYPGFESISGPDLVAKMREQALKWDVKMLEETVIDVVRLTDYTLTCLVTGEDRRSRGNEGETRVTGEVLHKYNFLLSTKSGRQYLCKALIIATGASANTLDVPGKDEFWQKGVSSCCVCDGACSIFRNKPTIICGGGDTAMEESLFMTKYSSKVYIVHRRDTLRASKVMQARVKANPKIEILYNTKLEEIKGDKLVNQVVLSNTLTGVPSILDVSGVFFAIGHTPNTSFLQRNFPQLLNENGYINTTPGSTCTQIPGLFAAGDCQDFKYRQAITSCGSGCMAALDVEHYLSGH